MTEPAFYSVRPIGIIRSDLKCRAKAPLQGQEGAPDAWLEVDPCLQEGLQDLLPGQEVIIITWLQEAQRDTLKVHPRNDENTPLTGVFSTRSAERPNPLGLHPVTIREIAGNRVRIGPIEASDSFRKEVPAPVERGGEIAGGVEGPELMMAARRLGRYCDLTNNTL
jgi:tRNA-Thr(GGU) m(6)t(6)A37 methyltransferase TsaA